MADDDVTDGGRADPKDKKKAENRQRMMVIVGVVGLILTYVLIKRGQASSGAGGANTSADQALAQYEQQNQSNLAGLASSLQALQSQVAAETPVTASNTGTTSPATPTYTPPTNEISQYGGYGPQPGATSQTVSDAAGNVYEWLPTGPSVGSAIQAGDTLYTQTVPGVFTAGNPAPWEPTYVKVPSNTNAQS